MVSEWLEKFPLVVCKPLSKFFPHAVHSRTEQGHGARQAREQEVPAMGLVAMAAVLISTFVMERVLMTVVGKTFSPCAGKNRAICGGAGQ